MGFERSRLARDALLGLALIPVSLVIIFAGTSVAGLIVYGTVALAARVQALGRSTGLTLAVVAFAWALQHAFMPLTFDARFMAFRVLASVPFSAFEVFLYLRFRRLIPLALAHALMDGATVLIPVLKEPDDGY